ncbi:hypothetical protein ILUMI_02056 [Ignelater luminosus]|uniref:Uncharacterized protein n=1 Tax=Ignelater luminosus TaxID=2038154 RepID=A0A8K0DH48_IGNLU|nr:hypothetical protein ILUMI_02056 [Ignelater luminosus]
MWLFGAFLMLMGVVQYAFGGAPISKTIKSALQMEMFDLDSLFLEYARPPLVWPLEKGITYRGLGWIPDSTKFPANLPEGKWKVPIVFMFGNKTTIAIATCTVMDQHRYIVYQEKLEMEDVNHKLLDIEGNVYKLNETTNGLNVTFKFKIDLPEDTMVFANAIRAVRGEYRSNLLQISKTVKSILHMEMFDLDSFYLRYTRPPMTWPLEKGVTYHCLGWSPDSTKFPPSLPVGEWKVPIIIRFANKTKLFVANWYLRFVAIH